MQEALLRLMEVTNAENLQKLSVSGGGW
jgi:hypothetical protein